MVRTLRFDLTTDPINLVAAGLEEGNRYDVELVETDADLESGADPRRARLVTADPRTTAADAKAHGVYRSLVPGEAAVIFVERSMAVWAWMATGDGRLAADSIVPSYPQS